MIHEAKVKLFRESYLHFVRKQDITQYQPDKQYDLFVMVDRHYITVLEHSSNPVCRIKTKIVDTNLLNHGNKEDDKQVTLYYSPPSKTGESEHIPIACIRSSKAAIVEIRESIGSNHKYKSCLAFMPSKVKHISILSGESPTQKFRGFLNLAGIMFLILNLRSIIENFIGYGIMFEETPLQFIPLHFMLASLCLFLFPTISFAVEKTKIKGNLSPLFAKIIIYFNLVSLLIFNTLYCLAYKPYPLLAVVFTSLAVIIELKLISYYQVNAQLYAIVQRLQKTSFKKSSQKQIETEMFTHYEISQQNLDEIIRNGSNWTGIVDYRHLLYFLCAPTLCYQLTYPKSASIRYIWLGKRCAELIIVSGLQLILWFQYIEPELKQLLLQIHDPNSTWIELLNTHLRLAIPNTIMWITGFYSVFHLWLNIIGEVLHFGDRNFYRDWWNCRSIEEYWKTWNLPVHFWFIRHVYNPLLQMGSSKTLANLAVFFVSAVAHEYIVSVPLGFISCWAFLAMMMQAPAILVEKKAKGILRIENSELSNASFWIFFCIIGQPLVVFIYYAIYIDLVTSMNSSKTPGFIPIQLPKIQSL